MSDIFEIDHENMNIVCKKTPKEIYLEHKNEFSQGVQPERLWLDYLESHSVSFVGNERVIILRRPHITIARPHGRFFELKRELTVFTQNQLDAFKEKHRRELKVKKYI